MTALLPFTQAQFLDVFRQYHAGIGVGQALILMVAVVGLSFAFWDTRLAARVVNSALAILWTWMAVVYHGRFFSRIHPAAILFAVLFAVQAALFLWEGVGQDNLRFRFSATLRGWMGALAITYAIAIYPGMGFVFGHYYPAAPTFGTPGPTVIFTIGLLLWSNAAWKVIAIPILWAALGSLAAFQLQMPQDYGLAGAALLMVALPGKRLQ